MKVGLRVVRGGLVGALIAIALPVASLIGTVTVSSSAYAQTVSSIEVQGNQRVETETVRSYFKPGPGGRLDAAAIDDGLKALYQTGLFQDVKVNPVGGKVVVTVVENPVIARVAFEGNKKVKDDQLSVEVQSKVRGTFSRPVVQADVQRIIEIYQHAGRYDVRVDPQVIDEPNNRVDLIFNITENSKTGIAAINFVGNNAFSSYRLKDVIQTKETNFLSFLSSADVYDPDRVEADRDLIRRYYLKNGYADVQVVAALTEYSPDKKGFLITFKIDEGQQYRVASIDVKSTIRGLDTDAMRGFIRLSQGSVYNGEAVEKSVEDMAIEASRRGFAFATVRPEGNRDFQSHTVSIVFNVDDGPRVYIERINIRGNTRTRDYVIRREFDISEGDAYNKALVDRAERRLKNLDYFKTVKITQEPGSSPDRVILNVDLEEKSTGEFSVSGGYSTSDGFLAEASVSERNLLGTGLYAKVGVSWGQYSHGYNLSIVEPYLLGYRVAGGLDLFQKVQNASSYVSYDTKTAGFSTRLGFQLREDLSLQIRYTLSSTEITIPSQYANCNNDPNSPYYDPTPAYIAANPGALAGPQGAPLYCYSDGEASLPVKIEMGNGRVITSAPGYSLSYNVLDNNQNPTTGLLATFNQDFAGVGGDVKFIKSTVDAKYYVPLVEDLVGVIHGQAGHVTGWDSSAVRFLDNFQMGPNLVRGFAPSGIGPRDITYGTTQDALGGTMYWGASAEVQMPLWFLPKEVGIKVAAYADAGDLWGYKGPTSNPGTAETLTPYDDQKIRSSAGVGLIWQSPFGPLRFDYAVPITKSPNDRVQQFRFGGGTSF
jgi:outer membrane protein insertion porin family